MSPERSSLPVRSTLAACSSAEDAGNDDGDDTISEATTGDGTAATPAGTEATAPAGTGGSEDTVDLVQGGDITIEVVTHGQASDPFWSVVKKGVDDAAAMTGATVNYSAPATFDMVQMSQLIDAAVAKGPDGLVVSVPDYDALQDSLAAATDAGIPIITINSGSDVYQEIGALTHVGQDETVAGEGAGARSGRGRGDEGDLHQPGGRQRRPRRPLRRRQDGDRGGRRNARGGAGRPQRRRRRAEHDQLGAAVRPRHRRHPGPRARPGAAPALAAKQDIGSDAINWRRSTSAPRCSTPSRPATWSFAVDQQQYIQGYLPIVFLTLYAQNLNTVGGGLPVLTGPGFVTPENAAQVKDLAAAGTR